MNNASSGLSGAIRELRELFDMGVMSKDELRENVKLLMAGAANSDKYQHPQVQNQVVINNHHTAASKALNSAKKYRSKCSPETLMIREMVDGPITRRFRLQCAKPESKLFGAVPPRRLNKKLFKVAVKSPLEGIFTRHAEDLKNVAGSKVVKVCKWKIAKMRGNLKNKDPAKFVFDDDKFDFEYHAAQLARPIPQRQLQQRQTPRTSPSQQSSRRQQPRQTPAPAVASHQPQQSSRQQQQRQTPSPARRSAFTPTQSLTPTRRQTPPPPPRQTPSKKTSTPAKPSTPDKPSTTNFAPGDRVSAIWPGDKKWYPATIKNVRTFKNGSTHIKVCLIHRSPHTH